MYSDVFYMQKNCHVNFIHTLAYKQYLGAGTKLQLQHWRERQGGSRNVL